MNKIKKMKQKCNRHLTRNPNSLLYMSPEARKRANKHRRCNHKPGDRMVMFYLENPIFNNVRFRGDKPVFTAPQTTTNQFDPKTKKHKTINILTPPEKKKIQGVECVLYRSGNDHMVTESGAQVRISRGNN